MKEIKKITIGGEEFPIKFGLNQTIVYCELRNISVNDYQKQISNIQNGTGGELRDLIWSALKDGARYAKTKFDYTPYDVGDWIEELTEEELVEIINSMTDTLPSPKVEAVKKKQVKKES